MPLLVYLFGGAALFGGGGLFLLGAGDAIEETGNTAVKAGLGAALGFGAWAIATGKVEL